MKKYLPWVAGIVIVAGVIGYGAAQIGKSKENNPTTVSNTSRSSVASAPPQACDVFTLDTARKVLGDTAEKPEGVSTPGASSDDIEVTQCIYQTPVTDLASIKSQKQASLLVRGSKTEVGTKSNEEIFTGSLKPAEGQDVSGYGDAAFWNPQFGQMNILKSGNWYILQVGATTPNERTLDDAKKLADALIGKL